MGFEEGAIVSLRNNRAMRKGPSLFTKVNTDIKRDMRKQSRLRNNTANHRNYELTKAYKAYAFKRDLRTAVVIVVMISIVVYFTLLYFDLL